jgi:hypothetical protein
MAVTESQHLVTMAEIEDTERRSRIKKAWDAYYGEAPYPLKARRNETTNDNVRINMARSIVDGGVAKLFGTKLAVTAGGEGPDSAQDIIDQTLRVSGGGLLWLRAGLSGGIGGTMFYRLSPRDDGSVRIIILDPQNVECEWDPDDYDIINRWCVTWNTLVNGQGVVRRQIVEPSGLGWVIIDQELRETNDKTGETAWVTIGTTDWPHPYPPLGHAQNLPSPHTVYGISDIEPDTLALIASIERSISNIARIVRLYAHPRTWGKMIGDALNIDANPGSVLRLESPDAMLANLEMQSDLSGALTLYRELMGALRETTRMPDVAAGKLDTTAPLSGVALQILYAPLVEKTEAKQETYGAAIVEMFRRILDLSGLGDDNIVSIGWPEIVPSDPLAERQTAVIDQGLGVSSQTLMTKLGYDPETEQAQRSAEDAAKAEAQTRSFNAGQLGGGQMPPSDAAVAAYDQSGRSAPA